VSVLLEGCKSIITTSYNHSRDLAISFSFELRPVVKLKIEIGAHLRTPRLVLTSNNVNPKRGDHLTKLGPHRFMANRRALIDRELYEEKAGRKARCATDYLIIDL